MLAESRPSSRQSEGKAHPGLIKHQMDKEVIVLLSSALLCLHWEYCVHFWAPKCEKVFGEDGKVPEGIQRKATKLMKGIEGMSCGEWPRTPGLSSLERRGLSHLLALCRFLRRGSAQRGAELFSQVSKDRTHGNGLKAVQGRSGLDIRKHFRTKKVGKHGNTSLPGEVVNAPGLSVLKRHLDNALSNVP